MRAKATTRSPAGPPRARQQAARSKPAAPPAPKYFSYNDEKSVDGYFSSKLSKSIENLSKSTDMLRLSKSANAPAKTNGTHPPRKKT